MPVPRRRGLGRWIRDNDPDGWAEATGFDRAIRPGYPHATRQGQESRRR
ncbi:hypothetical protein [Actinoalloteichus spitiensis]|nr:hypothetical protein [Actinoalloteichus spitiensis]